MRPSSTIARLLLAASLAAGLSMAGPGHAADDRSSKAFVPDDAPDRALLFIFREKRFVKAAVVATIKIDGKTVGELFNGGLLVAHAHPGDMQLEIRGDMDFFSRLVVPLHTEPGQTYYLLVSGQPPVGVALPSGGFVTFPQAEGGDDTTCGTGSWCLQVLDPAEGAAKIHRPGRR